MPIRLQCLCKRTIQVRDELAGKRIRCPECQVALSVPGLTESAIHPAPISGSTSMRAAAPEHSSRRSPQQTPDRQFDDEPCDYEQFDTAKSDTLTTSDSTGNKQSRAWIRVFLSLLMLITGMTGWFSWHLVRTSLRNPEEIAADDLKSIARNVVAQTDRQSPDYTPTPGKEKLQQLLSRENSTPEEKEAFGRLNEYEVLFDYLSRVPTTDVWWNQLVAYEKKAIANGGLCVLADGDVRRVRGADLVYAIGRMRSIDNALDTSEQTLDTLIGELSLLKASGKCLDISSSFSFCMPGPSDHKVKTGVSPWGIVQATSYEYAWIGIGLLASCTEHPEGMLETAALTGSDVLEETVRGAMKRAGGNLQLDRQSGEEGNRKWLKVHYSYPRGNDSSGNPRDPGVEFINSHLIGNEVFTLIVVFDQQVFENQRQKAETLRQSFFDSVQFRIPVSTAPAMIEPKKSRPPDNTELSAPEIRHPSIADSPPAAALSPDPLPAQLLPQEPLPAAAKKTDVVWDSTAAVEALETERRMRPKESVAPDESSRPKKRQGLPLQVFGYTAYSGNGDIVAAARKALTGLPSVIAEEVTVDEANHEIHIPMTPADAHGSSPYRNALLKAGFELTYSMFSNMGRPLPKE